MIVPWWMSYVNRGDVVLDIGANVGDISRAFLESVGLTGIVYAVEPAPKCYEKLCGLTREYSNFLPFRYAMGRGHKTETVFHYGCWTLLKVNPVDNRYVNRDGLCHLGHDKSEKEEFEAKYIPLDTLAWVLHAMPRVVKIDVDGSTFDVLVGGTGFIMRHKPRLIVEVGSEQPEHESAGSSIKLLGSFGYRLIDKDGEISEDMAISRVPSNGTLDLVCLPRDIRDINVSF